MNLVFKPIVSGLITFIITMLLFFPFIGCGGKPVTDQKLEYTPPDKL